MLSPSPNEHGPRRWLPAVGAGVLLLLGAVALAHWVLWPVPRFVFIDGGAHKGETIAHFVKTVEYGRHDWEMFSFEASPVTAAEIPPRPDLQVLPVAMWTYDGEIEFFVGAVTSSSSLLAHKTTGQLSKVPVQVPCIDFSAWLAEHVEAADVVVLKMDIEGAEYDVLDKMLRDGTMALVDWLYIEFHNERVGVSRDRDQAILERLRELDIPVVHEVPGRPLGDWFHSG